jgi:hypothetical protein
MADAIRRWEAYWDGEIIDRPVVCVTALHKDTARDEPLLPDANYHERVFGDIDANIDRALYRAERTFWGGEAIPAYFPSFGPDEMAVFCGAELCWNPDSGDTNWSKSFVEDWEQALPLKLDVQHPLWLRLLEVYRRAAARMEGKLLLMPLDLHSNMDLLAGVRGPQRLCMDLMDCPEQIDLAMASARQVFPLVWEAVSTAGKMAEHGFIQGGYGGKEGAAVLQCDFSAMIGPAMFRRWVLPALEEEAEIVKHAFYHWDGPNALKHCPDLVKSRGLHTLGYVPGDHPIPRPEDRHVYHIPMYQEIQAAGKGVSVNGTAAEVKYMHKHLRPEKTIYNAAVQSQDEAEELLEWFTRNT